MNPNSLIQRILMKAKKAGLLDEADEIYAANRIAHLLHVDQLAKTEEAAGSGDLVSALDELVEYACEAGIIQDDFDERGILAADIMNTMMPLPSDVNRTFYRLYEQSPEEATRYFYELSKNSNYIQTKQIAKNIVYQVPTEYGDLDITINLSKPEKDPKQIAKERAAARPDAAYPKCLLCAENEGYAGRTGHPARSNHRIIRMQVPNENWYLQYSPYLYYNEHCILLSGEHRNMKISRDAFERLLAFTAQFPHYFIGSNADIPIVGGSILTHDHYQGGRYDFAMAKAEIEDSFSWKSYPGIECGIVKWPMSVIRLKSKDRYELVEAGDEILQAWKEYSDPERQIVAYTGEVPHNTITPIARKRNGKFELDLVLRNNRTNEDHPLGIFHPHADIHHIKKENIGLIEVMGLAVLPARLEQELKDVSAYLLGESDQMADYHREWAEELKDKYLGTLTKDTVSAIIHQEVGGKFLRALQDAGVFKRDTDGKRGFREFIRSQVLKEV